MFGQAPRHPARPEVVLSGTSRECGVGTIFELIESLVAERERLKVTVGQRCDIDVGASKGLERSGTKRLT